MIIYFVTACCYDLGESFPDGATHDDSIISFNYIKYMTASLQGMSELPMGI